jgi:glutamate N-acetyltransferase / amino-acid N-acetyltransferase
MAKNLALSPLAPADVPNLPALDGVMLGATYAGLRYAPGRHDVLLVMLPPETVCAGVFTKSLTASPAIHASKQALADSGGRARMLIVAAGNSVAGTGVGGHFACAEITAAAGRQLDCPASHIQFAATGVIGEPFPTPKLLAALPDAQAVATTTDWAVAARAICTTDTFPKLVTRTLDIDGRQVTLNGFIKGSGMIQPNMATMLGFIFTDAAIAPDVLQTLLGNSAERTFNCITVDSDTSTSDTVLAFATGKAGNAVIEDATSHAAQQFAAALGAVCLELAQLVVRDGEGAQKLITINVTGAMSFESARIIGLSIANSPLMKTAIAGEDANWGRVVMAVGKAGEPINAYNLSVAFGGTMICKRGMRVEGYDETPVVAHLKTRDIIIDVDVGVGTGTATVYTCDLTHGYISINADYRS